MRSNEDGRAQKVRIYAAYRVSQLPSINNERKVKTSMKGSGEQTLFDKRVLSCVQETAAAVTGRMFAFGNYLSYGDPDGGREANHLPSGRFRL